MSGTEPHILYLTGEYPPTHGGVGDYTANLRSALESRRATVSIAAGGRGSTPDVSRIEHWDTRSVRTTAAFARDRNVDLVHIQYQAGAFAMRPVVNLFPTLLRRMLDRPVLTTFHDLCPPYLFPKAGGLRAHAITQMARSSNAAIVTNPLDRRELRKRGIFAVEIPIGPNLPAVEAVSVGACRTVTFFGLPTRAKGILELVAAVAKIPLCSRPPLVLIGATGTPSPSNDIAPIERIERLAIDRGVDLRCTGFLDPTDASAELSKAGVIVLPFLKGATLRSGSLLAALNSGRPVITTAPNNLADLGELRSMRQLRLVPRMDAEALAAAITGSLACSLEVEPLPMSYSWPAIAERHLQLYASLLAGPAP